MASSYTKPTETLRSRPGSEGPTPDPEAESGPDLKTVDNGHTNTSAEWFLLQHTEEVLQNQNSSRQQSGTGSAPGESKEGCCALLKGRTAVCYGSDENREPSGELLAGPS